MQINNICLLNNQFIYTDTIMTVSNSNSVNELYDIIGEEKILKLHMQE